MKNRRYISSTVFMLIGAIIGGVCGYIYWREVGCLTGNCPITANPWSNVLFGGAVGALILSIVGDLWNKGIKKNKNKQEEEKEEK